MTSKLEEFFNSIKGKALLSETGDNVKDKTAKSFYVALKMSQKNYNAEGATKTCTFFSCEKQNYALLKNKETVVNQPQNIVDNSIRLNRFLISKGVSTPKLYTMFFADKKFYEVFDRGSGLQIYLSVKKTVVKNALNLEENITSKNIKLTAEEIKKIGNYVFNYNLNNQQILLKLPQEAYDKLLTDLKLLVDLGFRYIDTNTGNVLVNKTGFCLIDIDYESALRCMRSDLEMITGKKCTDDDVINRIEKYGFCINPRVSTIFKKDEEQLCEAFLYPFISSRDFSTFLNNTQIETLKHNDVKILKKVVQAISNLNLSFSLENGNCKYLLQTLFPNFEDYYEVIKPQLNSTINKGKI